MFAFETFYATITARSARVGIELAEFAVLRPTCHKLCAVRACRTEASTLCSGWERIHGSRDAHESITAVLSRSRRHAADASFTAVLVGCASKASCIADCILTCAILSDWTIRWIRCLLWTIGSFKTRFRHEFIYRAVETRGALRRNISKTRCAAYVTFLARITVGN
jgi:hypothetical protein